MSVNSTAISKLFRPGLDKVYGDYTQWPVEWKKVFTPYVSDKNYEEDVEYRGTGMAAIKPEGEPSALDIMPGTRNSTIYKHKTVSLSTQITHEAFADNLYKNQFRIGTEFLKQSLIATQETLAMSLFNNAFNAAFPMGDGQPLCSLVNPIDGGVYANKPATAVDLNEAAIESAIINLATLKSAAGLQIKVIGEQLLIPPALQFTACRLLESDKRPMTNNNDVNAINYMNVLSKGFTVNHYLLNSSAWFIITSANREDGLKMFRREKVTSKYHTDERTRNILIAVFERYSFGCSNKRAVWGSAGLSS